MITYPNVKVNLGLNVIRRREDGYHDIDTVFLPYGEIHDTLEIITGDDWSRTSAGIFSSGAPVAQAISPDGALMITIERKEGIDWDPLKDLTAKAYFLLAEEFKLPPVKIFLRKLSPVGAGLGGGSADAAFALSMISELFSLGLSLEELAARASKLGSDCAFFIYNRPMRGEGRGEILTPFSLDLKGYHLKVFIPEGVSVNTAEAYRGIVPSKPEIPLSEALSHDIPEWKDIVVNDFEKTVFKIYPSLEEMKMQIYESGAVYASMSGSGSALFGIFKD